MNSTDTKEAMDPVAPKDELPKNNSVRKKLFLVLATVVSVCAIAYGTYWFIYKSHYASTDNAYTATEIAQVTPSVGGTVKAVNVVDTQSVKQGDLLVVIDEIDAQLAVSQAKADHSRAKAQLALYQANYARASVDYTRRKALVDSGSVSGDEFTNAKNAYIAGKANLEAAQAEIEATAARLKQTKVDLERTAVRAPVDGVISKLSVQIGQVVSKGASLLAIVPLHKMHVDANFKESELKDVRIGQKAEMYADIYGKSVIYHGEVEGFSGGTGSAFALIPAQNATGNWIKVVQRLPVRIKLDPEELKAKPLQVGLSINVTIDTKSNSK